MLVKEATGKLYDCLSAGEVIVTAVEKSQVSNHTKPIRSM